MATADDVVVEFEARVAGYERDLKRAQRTFEQTTKAQESRMAAFERRMGAGFGRIVGAIATAAAAREMLRMVDAGKQIEAQLRLATRESGSFAQAQEDVRRIAMETRSGLEDTARLYGNFQRNAQQLGITQEQAARATETTTKAFRISGAAAVESSQGTRQLIQALQSGVLRGDEFNSIMEAAPRLSKLFATSLGVTQGELRKMAEEGELTSKKLVDALTNTKFTAGIDAEFREMPVTFDQAMQQVENAAIITFSAFDRGGGFSQMLANFVTDGVNGFAELEQSAVETGIDIRSSFEGLADVFEPMLEGARITFGEIGLLGQSLSEQLSNTFREIDTITKYANASVKFRMGPAGPEMYLDTNQGTNLQQRFDASQQRAANQRRGELAVQALDDRFRHYDMLGNPIRPSAPGGGGSAAGKPSRRRGPSAETLAGIREEGEKQRDLLAMQDDIIAARAALATAAEDVARFELQQLGIEQAARLSQLNTEKRIGDLTQEEYDARAKALAEEMSLRRQAIERQRDETRKSDAIEVNAELLRRQNDQLALEADALSARAAIADTLEQRRFLEESALAIHQEIERSLLEQAIAEGKIADAAAARAALADRQAAESRGLEKQNQGALGRYLDSTSDPRAAAEEAAVREMEAVRDGLVDGLAEELGTKNQFVKDMFSIFLDQVIFRPLAESLRSAGSGGGGGFGGFLGSVVTAVSSIFGAPHAIGGPARAGQPIEVGENGREVFVPQQAGVIVPNHRLRGSGSGTTIYHSPVYDMRGALVAERVYEDINRISRANAAQAGARAYDQSMRDAPKAIRSAQRYGGR